MKNKKQTFFRLLNFCSFFPFTTLFILPSCSVSKQISLKCVHNLEYGNCNILIEPESFEKNGFHLGDSLKIFFNDIDITYKNVPYYNGYYSDNNQPLIIRQSSYLYFSFKNSSYDLWIDHNLGEETSITISMFKKRKFIEIQNLLDLSYTLERNDYDSDEIYANFHYVSGGNLKDNFLYRGCTPCPVSIIGDRCLYVRKLLENNKITHFINLSNSEEELQQFLDNEDSSLDYYRDMWKNNAYITNHFSVISNDIESKLQIVKLFKSMIEKNITANDKIYIHCNEGKDRTGVICIIVESLCNCDYQTILNDYLLSFINFYKLDFQKDIKRINAIIKYYFNQLISLLSSENEVKDSYENINFKEIASSYLKAGGMSDNDIIKLTNLFSKQ